MTIFHTNATQLLWDVVIIKILLVDLLRFVIKWLYKLTKRLVIRTEADMVEYIYWRNKTLKNRLRK